MYKQTQPPSEPSIHGTLPPPNGADAQETSGLLLDEEEGALEDPGTAAPLEASDTEIPEADQSEGIDPQVAEAFIENKRIGDRIKYLRQRKQMGLVELGRHTGLSASFLSQLETGRVVPTLRNLARIAMVFSKDMSYFFEPERPELFRILRADERQKLPQTGVDDPGYFFESLGHVPLDGGISPYVAEFLTATDRRQPRAHGHPGAEFLYVLSGCLRLTHEGQVEDLEQGDAVFFHASTTHSYERVGKRRLHRSDHHPAGPSARASQRLPHSGSQRKIRHCSPAQTPPPELGNLGVREGRGFSHAVNAVVAMRL